LVSPKVYPQARSTGLAAVREATRSYRAHLIEIAVEGGEPPHPMIGVETEGDSETLAKPWAK
jgi:hypothetical protein